LAVVGLCGGAGATTLAYLLARHARVTRQTPVIVCDTGGLSGGLSACSGVVSPHSLPGLAQTIADRVPLAGSPFAADDSGLRVIADVPALDVVADENAVQRVLGDARETHELTVVDCGTLATRLSRQVFSTASHAAWILPASAGALGRAAAVLDLFAPNATRREILVARADEAESRPPIKRLASLAEGRAAPLVLMPRIRALTPGDVDAAREHAAVGLEAILASLRS
jgi:MinD-like ATPase involved in chromosome partitioning or flagellar assembly